MKPALQSRLAAHFELGELEISDPELSYRSSAEPLLLEASSLDMEIAAALKLLDANEESQIAEGRAIRVASQSWISGFEVQQYGREIGIPVVDGASKFLHGTRFLSDLEQTKGYEFDTMVIVNCAQGQLPPRGAPEQEVFRNAGEFYVAMTRAKGQLIPSFSGKVCDWADLKVALHVGLGGRASEHVRVGIDESQILALPFSEALSAEAASA